MQPGGGPRPRGADVVLLAQRVAQRGARRHRNDLHGGVLFNRGIMKPLSWYLVVSKLLGVFKPFLFPS